MCGERKEKEATKRRHCKGNNYLNRNKEQCRKCIDPMSTITTTLTKTTTTTTTTKQRGSKCPK